MTTLPTQSFPPADAPLMNESLYLMYRRFFPVPHPQLTRVSSAQEIYDHIARRFAAIEGKIGIMLSGGMDSVMLAHFLPPGSVAYTLNYSETGEGLDEFEEAARFVPPGVEHKKVHVTSEQFFQNARAITILKREPTVPHDPAFVACAQAALKDGVTHMVTGGGADVRFGGFIHFYKAGERGFEDFRKAVIKQFVVPWKVLKDPAPVDWVMEHYRTGDTVDVQNFLAEVGTEGNAQSDTLEKMGLTPIIGYGDMEYEGVLEVSKKGSKYPLHQLFKLIYPGIKPNKKAALPVPYGAWMRGYVPHRPEFRTDYIESFGGKNKYQIYALELYMDLRDDYGWQTPPARQLYAESGAA